VTTTGTTNSTSVDWSALIDAESMPKLTQATSVSTTITANEARVPPYQTLQTDLSTLASGLSSLATSVVSIRWPPTCSLPARRR